MTNEKKKKLMEEKIITRSIYKIEKKSLLDFLDITDENIIIKSCIVSNNDLIIKVSNDN